jgi:hypothetical protein
MITALDFLLDFISVDLIIGFGWYSIVFFSLLLFSVKKEFLIEFDKSACRTVVYLGILYGLVWFSASILNYLVEMDEDQKSQFIRLLTGKYSFGLWFQPLFWVALTQLLRIQFVRKYLLLRVMICIFFILTFERFVIIYTSFQRDYLPSSWTLYNYGFGITWWQILLSALIKMFEFTLVVYVYKYLKNQKSKIKNR